MSRYNDFIGYEWGDQPGQYNCWTFVKEVYQHVHGIDIPSYKEIEYDENKKSEIAVKIKETDLYKEYQKVEDPQEGDAVIFNLAGHPIHIGLMISPTKFIHCARGSLSCIEDVRDTKWKRRVQAFYRHKSF